MKARTADAIRRLLDDPAATDGEKAAARARLAAAGAHEPPPRPPTAVGAPAPHDGPLWGPYGWSGTTTNEWAGGSDWVTVRFRFTVSQ